MALSRKVGSFNIGTGAAGTTVAVSDVGFTPEVIFFWWSGRTESTDASGAATHLRGFGWTTGTTAANNRCIGTRSQNAVGSAIMDSCHREDACIVEQGNGAIVGWADLQSFDAGGFTLEILDAFTTSLRVCYLAIAGDVTVVGTGRFTAQAGTGSQSVTGLPSQPDFVAFMSSVGADPPGTAVDSGYAIGVASGPSNEFVVAGGSNDGLSTMQAMSYGYGGESVVNWDAGVTALQARAEFTQFNSDGFSVNWLEATAGLRIHYLALHFGGKVKVGNLLTKTDTTDIVVSSLGFPPKALLFLSHAKAQSTQDTPQDHDQWSMGAATSTTERVATGMYDKDAIGDSDVLTAIEHDEVYVSLSDTAVVGLMDLKSLDADGFTCVMDDTDPSAAMVGYVAFGETVSSVVIPVIAHHLRQQAIQ